VGRPTARCFIVTEDGTRIDLSRRGLLVGRALEADLHLEDPRASRRHALLFVDADGPRIVGLGRAPVLQNGVAIMEDADLGHGDKLTFPGAVFRVEVSGPAPGARSGWVVKVTRGASADALPVIRELPADPFLVGGGEGDDLRIPEWMPRLLSLRPRFERWEARVGRGLLRNGRLCEPDTPFPTDSGDRYSCNGVTLRLVNAAISEAATLFSDSDEMPLDVELQPLPPAGGQLTLRDAHEERTVFVSGLRFDLLLTLLAPRAGLEPGDPVPDAVVLSRVWGRQQPRDRKAVTILLKRLRADLERGGIDASSLVVHEAGRSSFRLGRGARVRLLDPR
jgi:hypothetical protein